MQSLRWFAYGLYLGAVGLQLATVGMIAFLGFSLEQELNRPVHWWVKVFVTPFDVGQVWCVLAVYSAVKLWPDGKGVGVVWLIWLGQLATIYGMMTAHGGHHVAARVSYFLHVAICGVNVWFLLRLRREVPEQAA